MVNNTTDAQKMADIMSDVWIAFARTGNPNIKTIPEWPRLYFAPVRYIQQGT
jgi:para-nitrobenzyl esterase